MTADAWAVLAHTLALRAPMLLVGIVGLWFALSRRRRHPRVSLVAAVGFGCLLLNVLSFLALQGWTQVAVAQGGGPQAFERLAMWNFVGYPLNLIALASLAVAVFIDRAPTPEQA